MLELHPEGEMEELVRHRKYSGTLVQGPDTRGHAHSGDMPIHCECRVLWGSPKRAGGSSPRGPGGSKCHAEAAGLVLMVVGAFQGEFEK